MKYLSDTHGRGDWLNVACYCDDSLCKGSSFLRLSWWGRLRCQHVEVFRFHRPARRTGGWACYRCGKVLQEQKVDESGCTHKPLRSDFV